MPGHAVTTRDARMQMGPYVANDILGEGATGIVYRAQDAQGRPIALKVLRQELALSERERTRFLEEATRLRRVQHPSLVGIIDANVLPNGTPYIAMPYLEGGSLADRLQHGPMRFDVALNLFGQLADALHTLHHAGLVHRDIKPENIFVVAGDERALLLDLGIARDVNSGPSTTTHAGLIRGTPAYMAPERFFGAPASPATDIYELGVVLYFTLVGGLPWMRYDDPTERMRPASPAARGVPLPERLSSTIMRALAVSPGDRPQSASEFATAVIEALSPQSMNHYMSNIPPPGLLPPHSSDVFKPTAMAHRVEPTAPPQAGGPSFGPAAYAPTAVTHSSAPPQGSMRTSVPSYGQIVAPAMTAAEPFQPTGWNPQPVPAAAPTGFTGATPAKKKPKGLLVAVMTGATLLTTGALALVLMMGGFLREATNKSQPQAAAANRADNEKPVDSNAGTTTPSPMQTPAVMPGGQAGRTTRGIGNTTPPKGLGDSSSAKDRNVVPPSGSASAQPRIPEPPAETTPFSRDLLNCRNFQGYACRADVVAVIGSGDCSMVKGMIAVVEGKPDLQRTNNDAACASELRKKKLQFDRQK